VRLVRIRSEDGKECSDSKGFTISVTIDYSGFKGEYGDVRG